MTDAWVPPLFPTAEDILSSAWRGLSRTEDDVSHIGTFVSVGEPPSDCCSLLACWLVDYGPTAKATAREVSGASPSRMHMATEATFSVALWEGGYPIVERRSDRFILPKPSVTMEASHHLYDHAFLMYQGVMEDYRTGSLLLNPKSCPRFTFTKLRPLGPNGGCAGFGFQVVGTLDG